MRHEQLTKATAELVFSWKKLNKHAVGARHRFSFRALVSW